MILPTLDLSIFQAPAPTHKSVQTLAEARWVQVQWSKRGHATRAGISNGRHMVPYQGALKHLQLVDLTLIIVVTAS